MKNNARTYRTGVMAIVCVVFVFGSVTVAGSAGLTKNEIFIPPAAFTDDGEAPENLKIWYDYIVGRDVGCDVYAPIIFPKGAKRISYVRVYYKDTNATEITWFYLYSTDMRTGNYSELGGGTTSDSSEVQSYKIVPTPNAINRHYSYVIWIHLQPSIYVYGVKVRYTR